MKTILAIAITFIVTLTVGYIYTHTLFMNGYLNLEEQEIDANVRRLQYTLNNEIDFLGKLTNDGRPGISYDFMQRYSHKYIN
jgi:sensor domain CHASE-containing protein